MSTVRTYNPSRVVVVVGGFPVSGFADGAFVDIVMPSDGITSQVGADGEIARAINSDRRCTVTITLQQTSPANDFLSVLFNTDILTCGATMVPVLIQDLCGETIFMASQAWVVKMPDTQFSKEVTTRAWQLMTGAPAVHVVGGNSFN
jgi:hypothetical protein